VALRDGFELRVGRVKISILETPGHTPESVCLVVTDEEKSPEPWAVLTGDTLFIGDVGRPDLSTRHTPAQLAGLLYDSLHNKLMLLPTTWWCIRRTGPGRFVGVTCARNAPRRLGPRGSPNTALEIAAGRICATVDHQPAVSPRIFLKDAEINRAGAAPLGDLPELHAFRPGR